MEKVTADSSIIGTVQMHPEIVNIFMQYGLGCIGCMAANFETIGQGCRCSWDRRGCSDRRHQRLHR